MIPSTKIPLSLVAKRLNRALNADVGLAGLNILLHGWMRKGYANSATLRVRNRRDGYRWLSPAELDSFSAYAGYDLSGKTLHVTLPE